jgi:hypothetical protein
MIPFTRKSFFLLEMGQVESYKSERVAIKEPEKKGMSVPVGGGG